MFHDKYAWVGSEVPKNTFLPKRYYFRRSPKGNITSEGKCFDISENPMNNNNYPRMGSYCTTKQGFIKTSMGCRWESMTSVFAEFCHFMQFLIICRKKIKANTHLCCTPPGFQWNAGRWKCIPTKDFVGNTSEVCMLSAVPPPSLWRN